MKVTITKCDNGWLVQDHDAAIDGGDVLYVHQFDEYGEEKDQVKAFVELLYRVNSLLGPPTSRYSKARIHVGVKRGDKYEPKSS